MIDSTDAVRCTGVREVPRRRTPPAGVRFLDGSDTIVVAGMTSLEVWDARAGTMVDTWSFDGRPIAWTAVPGQRALLVASRTGGLRLVGDGGCTLLEFVLKAAALRFLGEEGPGLGAVRYVPDGERRRRTPVMHPPYGAVCDVGVDASGRRAIAAYGQAFALVWSLESGQLLACLGMDGCTTDERIYRVALSADGSLAAARSADGTLRIWDVATHTLLARLAAGTDMQEPPGDGDTQRVAGGAGPIAFLHDGRVLAAVRERLLVLDPSRGRASDVWHGHSPDGWIADDQALPRITDLRVSADRTRVLSVGMDATLRLWDARTGATTWHEMPDACCIDWGDLSSDGTAVVWAGCPGTRVWRFGA